MSNDKNQLTYEAASIGLLLDPIDMVAITTLVMQTRQDLHTHALHEVLMFALPNYLDEGKAYDG